MHDDVHPQHQYKDKLKIVSLLLLQWSGDF